MLNWDQTVAGQNMMSVISYNLPRIADSLEAIEQNSRIAKPDEEAIVEKLSEGIYQLLEPLCETIEVKEEEFSDNVKNLTSLVLMTRTLGIVSLFYNDDEKQGAIALKIEKAVLQSDTVRNALYQYYKEQEDRLHGIK